MKTSTSKRLRWNVAIWLAAGLFMTSTAGMASGPILPDPKAEARHQPQVEETANGISLVNITAPSSGGVSRNEYETFNVPDKGAILNNSYTLSKTELAGYVHRSGSCRRNRFCHCRIRHRIQLALPSAAGNAGQTDQRSRSGRRYG